VPKQQCAVVVFFQHPLQGKRQGQDVRPQEVMQMHPVTFKWKGRDENDLGLIAEEVEKINPLFVTYERGQI
jgi:Chaperone of endosialidase